MRASSRMICPGDGPTFGHAPMPGGRAGRGKFRAYRAAVLAIALLAIAPAVAAGQETRERQAEPISRRDLKRMLSGGTYAPQEIAAMIRRACLSFVPTATERELYRGLGAERSILSAIDACLSPPAPVQAPPSQLPAPQEASPPSTFASVREEGEPVQPAARSRTPAQSPAVEEPSDSGGEHRAPASEPAPREPSVPEAEAEAEVEPEAEVEAPVPAPTTEIEVEAPVPAPTTEIGVEAAATVPATDTELEILMPSPTPAPGSEVSRLRRLATAAASAGDAESALRIRRDIVSLTPEDPLAWFRLGEALASIGDRVGAREAFIRAATLDRARRRVRP